MHWHLDPRFDWGRRRGEISHRAGAVAIRDEGMALVARCWDAGEAGPDGDGLGARFEVAEGTAPLIVVTAHESQPWLLSDRKSIEDRLEETCEYWQRWVAAGRYEGPWKEAVERSEMCVGIPMFGMIESLNLGTSSGIVLYEVTKQRRDYQSRYRLRDKRGKRAEPLPIPSHLGE